VRRNSAEALDPARAADLKEALPIGLEVASDAPDMLAGQRLGAANTAAFQRIAATQVRGEDIAMAAGQVAGAFDLCGLDAPQTGRQARRGFPALVRKKSTTSK